MHERSIFPFLRLCRSFEMNFSTPDRSLTKSHAGSEQLQYWCVSCVIINNSSYPTVKHNITAYHAFGKY